MTRLWPIALLVVLVAVLTREFLPKTVQAPAPPPMIVTVHDTVRDTLRLRGPKVVTTDTVTLTIRETIHDTTVINVGADPAKRTNLWPVVAVEVGKKVGDTTTVTTFGLRTGQGAVARIYTPGPLLGLWADSNATPRLEFGSPPPPPRVPFWGKVKWAAIGFGGCQVAAGMTRLLHP